MLVPLPFAEIPTFIASLQLREGVAARALEFLILCASRTGEVTGAFAWGREATGYQYRIAA